MKNTLLALLICASSLSAMEKDREDIASPSAQSVVKQEEQPQAQQTQQQVPQAQQVDSTSNSTVGEKIINLADGVGQKSFTVAATSAALVGGAKAGILIGYTAAPYAAEAIFVPTIATVGAPLLAGPVAAASGLWLMYCGGKAVYSNSDVLYSGTKSMIAKTIYGIGNGASWLWSKLPSLTAEKGYEDAVIEEYKKEILQYEQYDQAVREYYETKFLEDGFVLINNDLDAVVEEYEKEILQYEQYDQAVREYYETKFLEDDFVLIDVDQNESVEK